MFPDPQLAIAARSFAEALSAVLFVFSRDGGDAHDGGAYSWPCARGNGCSGGASAQGLSCDPTPGRRAEPAWTLVAPGGLKSPADALPLSLASSARRRGPESDPPSAFEAVSTTALYSACDATTIFSPAAARPPEPGRQ
jgi:hypothetical protein